MPKYGLIVGFSPVIKVEWVNISSTGTGSTKIGNWKMEKKIRVLGIQKVAKTGNIRKKKTPVAGNMDHTRYISMQN